MDPFKEAGGGFTSARGIDPDIDADLVSSFDPGTLGVAQGFIMKAPNPFNPMEASINQMSAGSQDKNREKSTPEMIRDFQVMMQDTRGSQRLDRLDNTKMHSNIGGHYLQTMNKGMEADQKMGDLRVAAKDLAQRLETTGQQHLALNIDPNPNNRLGSGFFMRFGAEAVGTAAVSYAMGPFAGAAMGAGLMAANAMGKGSEATFNQTPTSFVVANSGPKHGRHARSEPGYYASSEPSPEQAAMSTPAGAAPESGKFNDMMSRGPGFGKVDPGRAYLAGQSLEGMLIKMAEDSPAGKVASKMAEDARINRELHEQRAKKGGVEATMDNIAQANDAQLKTPGPKINDVAPRLS